MEKDRKWKNYYDDNARYADVINEAGCNGFQLVRPEDLTNENPEEDGKSRDQLRKVAMGMNFALVGIENQEEMDYEFPLRNMSYDTARYQKQVKVISKEVRSYPKGLEPGEYLYGFKKDSKLNPIITFLMYYGKEPWKGPTCLHDMLDFTDIPESLRKMTPNYEINVIDVRRWKDTSVFQTDVRQVFEFIQCSDNKKKLAELVNRNPYFQNMDEVAFDVVSKYTNSKELVKAKEYEGKDGKYNMCKAIRDMMDDSREEGKALGREEGKALGREEGKALGRELGKAEERRCGAKALIETCQEFGSTEEDTIIRLIDKFEMEKKDACQYMELFWKEPVEA